MNRTITAFLLTCVIFSSQAESAHAFAYIFAGEANGIDIVTHPIGYTGVGGALNLTIGIDPTSVNFADMVISTQNVINTWNGQAVTTGNLVSGPLPSGSFDFESVLLHEMGHSLGLSHVNAASESGLAGANANYTKATNGADNVFNINAGVDGVIGTADDVRGDDVNLNYFKRTDNDPFTIAGTVDSTTYSRDLADLPAGDLFSTNADRDVATLLGYANTEAAMQQGTFNAEHQRTLAADDVAGIRYAESGLDEIAGTADDYDLTLSYVVWDGMAGSRPDIVIDFDNSTGFAVSQSGGTFLSADHLAITTNNILFNDTFSWYFNDTSNAAGVPEPGSMAMMLVVLGCLGFRRNRRTSESC